MELNETCLPPRCGHQRLPRFAARLRPLSQNSRQARQSLSQQSTCRPANSQLAPAERLQVAPARAKAPVAATRQIRARRQPLRLAPPDINGQPKSPSYRGSMSWPPDISGRCEFHRPALARQFHFASLGNVEPSLRRDSARLPPAVLRRKVVNRGLISITTSSRPSGSEPMTRSTPHVTARRRHGVERPETQSPWLVRSASLRQ